MAAKYYSRRVILVTAVFAGLSAVFYPLLSVSAGDFSYEPNAVRDTSYVWPKHLVKEVQLRLKENNIDPGKADGIYGPNTASGIRKYQSANRMMVNGQISDELLDKLGIH